MRKTLLLALIGIHLQTPALPADGKYGTDKAEARLYLDKQDREEQVWIPMRDGIRLSADIFFPEGERSSLPTILIRTPYDFRRVVDGRTEEIATFLRTGYAVVLEYERGRHWSEGQYTFLNGAFEDGYDTIEWIVNQAWSNKKVGTFGCSSSAEHQMGLACMSHPGHAAMIPMAPGAGIGVIGPFHEQGNFYRGGVWQGFWFAWYYDRGWTYRPSFPQHLSREDRIRLAQFFDIAPKMPAVNLDKQIFTLPLTDLRDSIEGPVSDLDDFIRRLPADPKWDQVELADEGDRFGVPSLWVFSWYDVAIAPNIAFYNYQRNNALTQRARDNQYMVIASTTHCGMGTETEETVIGERAMGDARFDYMKLFVDWFDHWLKGVQNGVTEQPKVQLYTMGRNAWSYHDQWPAKGTRFVRYYLESNGDANGRFGDGQLLDEPPQEGRTDELVYDPGRPVPSLGGSVCCFSEDFVGGSFDQSAIELRQDVLVYTSPELEQGMEVTGPIEIVLYVSSDVRDTDFTVKLLDVYPDERAYNLDESIQRARYRDGYDRPALMVLDKVYEIRIGPLTTSNYFERGHRIRIEVSSSNFPRFARNLNTGGNNFDESAWVVAHNKIHHSPEYPSHIVLPIVP